VTLAERLRRGEELRLLLVKPAAPADVEAAGYAGFDAVIVDAEHGAASGPAIEQQVRAADATGLPALVRVPGTDAAAILTALDAGATGIVVPHVRDPAGAAAAVAAAHYPPRGRRGLALTTRAGRHGTAPLAEHLARAAADTVVVVQIEDADAVPLARAIVAVDGVDAVLIGATDLSISLGHPGEPDHPEVRDAIASITAACHGAGIAAAMVVASSEQAGTWHRSGVPVAVFVATQLVRDAFAGAAAVGPRREPPAPVVFLPGMLGSAALWDEVASRLIGPLELRTARIDLDDTIAEMADSALAAAPPRFSLVGHSLGAIVALAVVRRAPDRVARLALVCASARQASDAQREAWSGMRERVHGDGFTSFVEEFALANVSAGRRADQLLVGKVVAMAHEVGPRGLDRQLRAQRDRPDSRPLLGAIGCPTLVVSAAEDTVCPGELQQELAGGIPGARLALLEHAGHMAPVEAPDALAGLLREFLIDA
jgi:4-hydroxy-2-oxoheptanedioate aldolase